MKNNDVVEIRKQIDNVNKVVAEYKPSNKKVVSTNDEIHKDSGLKNENFSKKPCEDTTEGTGEIEKEEVYNVIGSENDEYSSEYDSWLDYWEKNKGEIVADPFVCPACGKTKKKKSYDEKDEMTDGAVGGHVQNENGDIFICPICKRCNDGKENTPPFYVKKEILLPRTTQLD